MAVSYKLVFIVGPTAVGKSSLAFELAKKHNAIIFNADSVQTYTDLSIGTAKPSAQEFNQVPHKMFDFVSPPDRLTAGEYHDQARPLLDLCLQNSHVFVVGGSGFYIQALEKGLFQVGSSNPQLLEKYQKILNERGADRLHSELVQKDPDYAKLIPVNDCYRVLRALALIEEEGKTMAQIKNEFVQKQNKSQLKNPRFKIGLTMDRDLLRSRVTERTQAMIAAGLEYEVQGLLDRGLKEWHPMASVGYKETIAFIEGQQITRAQWAEQIVTSTMQLAKRQMTWFKRDKELQWFQAPEEHCLAFQAIESYLQTKL